MGRQIVVDIIGDPSKFESATKRAGDDADHLGIRMRDLSLGGLAAGAGAKAASAGIDLMGQAASSAVDFVKGSVTAASDLNETVSKSEVIFGTSADAVGKWAEGMDAAGGLSKRAALDAASGFAGLFQTVGIGIDKSADMSERMTQMGSDLASFFNTDVGDALAALKSGLNGESEPLRKFNVFLSESAVSAKAAAMGLQPVNGALTEGQKAAARYQLILEQTGAAQGDFARTADGLANSSRTLDAKMENLQARIGQALLPVLQDATNAAIGLMDSFDKVTDSSSSLIDRLQGVGDMWNQINPMGWGYNATMSDLAKRQKEAAAAADELAARQGEMAKRASEGTSSLDGMARSEIRAQVATNTLTGRIKAASEQTTVAAPKVVSLADAIRGGIDPTRELADALDSFFSTIVSNAYEPRQLRDDIASLTREIAGEQARIRELNGLRHRTPEQEAELRGLKSQLLDNNEQLDRAHVKLGTLNGASVSEITAAMQALRRNGINPDVAALGALNDRLVEAINHAKILSRALHGGQGGAVPVDKLASGGPGSGLTWVGEKGPELLDLPTGSYVHSNRESMAMAREPRAAAAPATSGPTIVVNINGGLVDGPTIDAVTNAIAQRLRFASGM